MDQNSQNIVLIHNSRPLGLLKGIFSDSNNIFLQRESEDINRKSLFPKFQLIPIWRFQVMNGYVCFNASIDYYVE